MTRKLTLNPTPFFVLKTRIIKLSDDLKEKLKLSDGCKLFINICTDPDIAPPKRKWIDAKTNMGVPMVVSNGRTDVDKKGAKSAVFDCVMNTRLAQECSIYKECHEFVLLASLDVVERISDCILDKDNLAMPKMKVKGIPQTEYEIPDGEYETVDDEEEKDDDLVLDIEEYAKSIVQSETGRDNKKTNKKIDKSTIESAEKLISDRFDPYNLEELTIPGSRSGLADQSDVNGSNKPTKPLIEEITSKSNPVFHFRKYTGPYNESGDRPSHTVEIETDEDVLKKTQLKLTDNGKRLLFGNLSIPLSQVAKNVEAFYVKEDSTLKAFIY